MAAAALPNNGFPPPIWPWLRDGFDKPVAHTGFSPQPHAEHHAPQAYSGPAAVRKADDFMRENASSAIGTGDIANAAVCLCAPCRKAIAKPVA